jgi:hypothetical protein
MVTAVKLDIWILILVFNAAQHCVTMQQLSEEFSPGSKAAAGGADHLTPSSSELKNGGLYPYSPICLHDFLLD